MAKPVVIVVEDDPDCLEAIVAELTHEGFEPRGFTSTEAPFARPSLFSSASAALVDLFIDSGHSFRFIAKVRQKHPELPIVALTGHASDDMVLRALRAGAVGYVLKHDALGRLGEVLRVVLSGGAPMTPSIARRLLASFHEPEPASGRLTERELEVLRALARGHTYDGCAASLGVTVDTIRTHVRRIYGKLQATSKAEAVAVAMRRGLLR